MEAPPPYSEIDPQTSRSSTSENVFVWTRGGARPPTMSPVYEVPHEDLFRPDEEKSLIPVVPSCSCMTFVDFVPLVSNIGNHREIFADLLERANSWLLTAENWRVTSCETIKQWIDDKTQTSRKDAAIYYEDSKKKKTFYFGLRLWITPRQSHCDPQTIGYVNLKPRQVRRRSRRRRDVEKVRMQNLKEILLGFRTAQEEEPLPGKILSVEVLKMSVSNINTFDCDTLLWQEEPLYDYQYMNVVRVFYEKGDPSHEIIGAMDFLPLRDIKLLGKDKVESVAQLTARAFKTLKDESEKEENMRLLNVQTLEVEITKGKKVDTSVLANKENTKKLEHSQFLRAFFVKTNTKCHKFSEKHTVTCKTFLPVVLPDSVSYTTLKAESTEKTKERLEAWLNATGCKVICSESVNIRSSIYERYEALDKKTKCLPYNEYRWVSAFKFYVDGEYEEPHETLLPALPKYEKSKCIVS